MSEEAKKIINTVKQGNLPPIPPTQSTPSKGLKSSQRGLNKLTFGLKNLSEGLDKKKK